MTTFAVRAQKFATGRSALVRMRHRIAMAATIVVLGCSVASCNGASSPKPASPATSPTTNVSPADLATRVSEICDAWEHALDARPRFAVEHFDPANPDPQLLPDVGGYFAPAADLQQHAIDRLEALKAHRSVQRDVDALIVALRAEVANTRAQIEAATNRNVDAFKTTVSKVSSLRAAVKRAAAPLDAAGCAFG